MRMRIEVVLKNTGERIFGGFTEVTQEELDAGLEFFKKLTKWDHFSFEDEKGDLVVFDPSSIAYIKMHNSAE